MGEADWETWRDRFETPACNWCGSPPANHKVILERAQEKPFNLVECQQCRLRFFSPRPKWDEIMKGGLGTSPGEREVAERCLRTGKLVVDVPDPEAQRNFLRGYYAGVLRKYVARVGPIESMFEVGPCVGWFLRIARENGVKVCVGCDVNKFAAELAQKEWKLSIYHSTFQRYEPKRRYDSVVMLDYIEHRGSGPGGAIYRFRTELLD